MVRILLLFIILLGSVVLGIQLNHDAGYLFISIHHWTIETSLLAAILIVLVTFFLLHALLILFGKIAKSPSLFQAWRAKSRAEKAQATTRRGLIEFSEGYWQKAKYDLIKALPDADTPLLNYLTAARAAQELGDYQLRDDYLREAQHSMPDAKIAVELTQAQLQLANKQWEQALATLKHLQLLVPKHPYVLKLLVHLFQEMNDWQHLLQLLPELNKYHVLNEADYKQLLHKTYLHAMSDLAHQGQTTALTEMANQLPKSLKRDADLMEIYCNHLIMTNQQALAEAILRQFLNKQFNAKLIRLYGQIFVNENQLTFAESLLKKHSDSADLYLCLGRLCLKQHLWGKARNYFEKSIEKHPNTEAYKELGTMLIELNDQSGACQAFQKGLELSGIPE